MKRHPIIAGALLLPLLFTPAAHAYPTYPPAPATPVCADTTTVLATAVSRVNTGTAGIHCLANGTYAGPVTINRTVAGTATLAGTSGYGAVIDGGIIHSGGSVTYRNLDLQNTTSGAGTNGDCFTEDAGVTAAVAIQYSTIHACNRNGVAQKRPACTPTPCTPTTGYANNLTVSMDIIKDVGNTDTTGNLLVLKLPSAADGGTALVAMNELTDTPNDVVNVWGNGLTFRQSYVHDVTAAGTNHNDVLQTWQYATSDGAQGLPVTNLTMERIRTRAINGTNAHFVESTGTGHSTWIIKNSEIVDIGTASHAIILGANSDVTGNVTGARIWSNTFYDVGYTQFANASDGQIRGNIWRACTEATGPWVLGTGVMTIDNNTGSGVAGCTASGTAFANRDPLFANAGLGDFHLTSTSPEIDTGNLNPGGSDIDDGTRVVDGDSNGTATVDRGSDEF